MKGHKQKKKKVQWASNHIKQSGRGGSLYGFNLTYKENSNITHLYISLTKEAGQDGCNSIKDVSDADRSYYLGQKIAKTILLP